jgi:adenylate cyclase
MTAARRLAAILAANVVGCSRLMARDETGTAKAVLERRETATLIVATLGGHRQDDDGVLLEFPSSVAAIECPVLIQNAPTN